MRPDALYLIKEIVQSMFVVFGTEKNYPRGTPIMQALITIHKWDFMTVKYSKRPHHLRKEAG